MKKIASAILTATALATLFAGCNSGNSSADSKASGFNTEKTISVVSREDGSGTRGAFIELFGIEVKGADGSKSDKTTKEATIAKATDVMLSNVSSNPYAIGYVSLGSLNSKVTALKIDGVEATAENIKNGTYKISRPFNIATKGEPTGLAKDFIDFIMSQEGQKVVSGSYIAVKEDAAAFAGAKPSGKIVVAGSSSVTPVMEKLKEAYLALNSQATIEIQQSDSSTGIQAAIDGTCDIGMASRELKDTEKASLTGLQIALDGVAVIVNPQNPLKDMTAEQVKSIYTGETTKWNGVIQ